MLMIRRGCLGLRPSDFCCGAQMIPCSPVIIPTFARQPMEASPMGRSKTPGTIQRRVSRVHLESWSPQGLYDTEGMTEGWVSSIFQWASCSHGGTLLTFRNPPFVMPLPMTSNGIRYQTRWEWSIKYKIFNIITFFFLTSCSPLHINPSPLPFTSPTPICEPSSERQITQWASLLALLSVQ